MPNYQIGKIDIEESEEENNEQQQNIGVDDVVPDLDTEDWYSKLNEDEIFNGPEGPAPRLRGLRRLARPFIKKEESRVNALICVPKEYSKELKVKNSAGSIMSTQETVMRIHYPMASVTVSITDTKDRVWSDSADAFFPNCEDLGLFPTAVASSRAEARALRKMLGIAQHAAEEMVDKDPEEELGIDENDNIKPEQQKLIEKLIKDSSASLKDLVTKVTTREVLQVKDLTRGEARKVIGLLHDIKKKDKRSKK